MGLNLPLFFFVFCLFHLFYVSLLSCLLLDGLHLFKSLDPPPTSMFLSFTWLPAKIEHAPLTYQSLKWQHHSCLQEHRRFSSLLFTCCHCLVLFLSMCLTIWDTVTAFCNQCYLAWPTYVSFCLLFLFVLIPPGIIFLLSDEHPLFPLVWVSTAWLCFCFYCIVIAEAYFYYIWNSSLVVISVPLSSVFLVVAEKHLLWGWFTWRSSEFFPLTAVKILSLVFRSFIVVCVCVDFFLFIWLGNC